MGYVLLTHWLNEVSGTPQHPKLSIKLLVTFHNLTVKMLKKLLLYVIKRKQLSWCPTRNFTLTNIHATRKDSICYKRREVITFYFNITSNIIQIKSRNLQSWPTYKTNIAIVVQVASEQAATF